MTLNHPRVIMVLQKYLQNKYYDPNFPGSYGGLEKFYRAIVREKPYITRAVVRKFLQTQDAYTLHVPVRKIFKRNKAHYTRPNEYWYMDLKDMSHFASDNDKYRYVLVVIDGFSRYAYAKPLHGKDTREVGKALVEIFTESGNNPAVLMSDAGGEFDSSHMRNILHTRGIKQVLSRNETKMAMVERVIYTLFNKIARYFTANDTTKWLDILQPVIARYRTAAAGSVRVV